MKRFANKLFSKLVLGAMIILLQFGWFVYLIYSATTVNSAVNIGFQVIAVALALSVAVTSLSAYSFLSAGARDFVCPIKAIPIRFT